MSAVKVVEEVMSIRNSILSSTTCTGLGRVDLDSLDPVTEMSTFSASDVAYGCSTLRIDDSLDTLRIPLLCVRILIVRWLFSRGVDTILLRLVFCMCLC